MSCLNQIDKVSDPEYVQTLQEKIRIIDERIKKAKKNKKTMETAQLHREKQINKVIDNGESNVLMDIRKLRTDIGIYQQKDSEISLMLERYNNVDNEITDKRKQFYLVVKGLKKEARELGIRVSKSKRQLLPQTKKKYANLAKTKELLTKAVALIKTRSNISYSDFMVEKNKLQRKINELSISIQHKNEYFSNYNRIWINYIDKLTNIGKYVKGPYMDIIEYTLKRWENMRGKFISHKLNKSPSIDNSQRTYNRIFIYRKRTEEIMKSRDHYRKSTNIIKKHTLKTSNVPKTLLKSVDVSKMTMKTTDISKPMFVLNRKKKKWDFNTNLCADEESKGIDDSKPPSELDPKYQRKSVNGIYALKKDETKNAFKFHDITPKNVINNYKEEIEIDKNVRKQHNTSQLEKPKKTYNFNKIKVDNSIGKIDEPLKINIWNNDNLEDNNIPSIDPNPLKHEDSSMFQSGDVAKPKQLFNFNRINKVKEEIKVNDEIDPLDKLFGKKPPIKQNEPPIEKEQKIDVLDFLAPDNESKVKNNEDNARNILDDLEEIEMN